MTINSTVRLFACDAQIVTNAQLTMEDASTNVRTRSAAIVVTVTAATHCTITGMIVRKVRYLYTCMCF